MYAHSFIHLLLQTSVIEGNFYITLIVAAKLPGTNKACPAYAQAQTTNNGPGYDAPWSILTHQSQYRTWEVDV